MTDLIAQPPSPPPAATLSLSQGGSDGSQPTPAAARYLQLRQEAAARLPPWARVATALPLGERFVGVPLVPDPLKNVGAGELHVEPNPSWFVEYCPVRGVFAVVMGYGMGIAMGVMFAGLSFSSPHLEPFSGAVPPKEAPSVPVWKQFAEGVRDMKARGMSTGKNFAIVGGVYATIECFLERLRGKRDMRNAIASGFTTGAVLAARGGPQAILFGGASFAAFSGAMELVIPLVFD